MNVQTRDGTNAPSQRVSKAASREFQVNEANEPSGMKQAGLSRTVGEKRQNSEEATRRSTRKRKGVDKMSGVMIHRVEYN